MTTYCRKSIDYKQKNGFPQIYLSEQMTLMIFYVSVVDKFLREIYFSEELVNHTHVKYH